ncbi:hypothetical protein TRFO_22888 [Tritrichomonas foetus]|uniref:Uncharacterized protein n=1 Tax=Tritrichomonas foetus TaxID=1144522 RepID=A0A1J4KGU3_9EUKA|nr:hypothetical protein TRFO_22888 [Tritrichomonas foetus]|eukprot:OHT08549.1 hypothetical protein TRFO_22888 [Tritrichomonas foetus]
MKSKYLEESDEEPDPPMFKVYDDEAECAATIKYHRKLIEQKNPEIPMKELFMYDVEIPNVENTEIVVPKIYYEEEPARKHLPKWIRNEVARDKKAWRQYHQALKRTPKYAPEYFEPLPEVKPAQRKFTQKDE